MRQYGEAAFLATVLMLAGCSQPQTQSTAPAPVTLAASTTNTPTPAAVAVAPSATAPSAGAGIAVASAPAKASGPVVMAPIALNADDAAKLTAWIMAQNTQSTDLPGKVVVGSTMPLEVVLHPIPASAGVSAAGASQYGIISNAIVLVDPTNYRILYVFS